MGQVRYELDLRRLIFINRKPQRFVRWELALCRLVFWAMNLTVMRGMLQTEEQEGPGGSLQARTAMGKGPSLANALRMAAECLQNTLHFTLSIVGVDYLSN